MEDTIQAISLLEPLHENKSNNDSISYQITVLELNGSAKLPKKDIEQLPTLSRTISPEPNTVL